MTKVLVAVDDTDESVAAIHVAQLFRSRLRRLLKSSVPDDVIREVRCPVSS